MSGVWRCLASVSADDSICMHTPKCTHAWKRETMELHKLEVGETRISEEGGEGASISLLLAVCLSASQTNQHPWWGCCLQPCPLSRGEPDWRLTVDFTVGFPWHFPLERIPSSIHAFIRSFIKHYQALTKYQVLFWAVEWVRAVENTVTELIASSWGIISAQILVMSSDKVHSLLSELLGDRLICWKF